MRNLTETHKAGVARHRLYCRRGLSRGATDCTLTNARYRNTSYAKPGFVLHRIH